MNTPIPTQASPSVDPVSLSALSTLFFRLGLTAFGGPVAHIAMMEDEVVSKRKWLTREAILDLIGITNLIPGPNSTQMAAQVGLATRGLLGMMIAGLSFITPAIAITIALAWLYVRFGTIPQVSGVWFGIRPAVVAIIATTVVKLAPKAMKKPELWVVAALVLAAVLTGWSPVAALFAGGIVGAVILRRESLGVGGTPVWLLSIAGIDTAATVAPAIITSDPSLVQLGFSFLRIGAILFGGGFVLIAYLREEFVFRLGWLTERGLLDAVAVGQFTPGPVLSTATFIGFEMQGFAGALVASVAIFLPSFLYVGLLKPIIPKLRKNAWTAAFLDAVGASAIALMASVVVDLFPSAVPNWRAGIICAAALAIIQFRPKVNLAWVVLGSATIGLVWGML